MTSPTYQALMAGRNADPEEEAELEYGADEEAEEDYDEEAEEGEGDGDEEEAEADYDEEDYGCEYPDNWEEKKDNIPHIAVEDRFFLGQTGKESLRQNYSEVEIGAFMKVLNVKPHRQWEDETTHHYKLGAHDYEDEAQELDATFHVLSEEERKAAERQKVQDWRRGTEIKIEVGDKKPLRFDYRF